MSTVWETCGRPSRSTPTNSIAGIFTKRRESAYFGETCSRRNGSENRLVLSFKNSQSLRCRAFELHRGQYPYGRTLSEVPPCVNARSFHPQQGQMCLFPRNNNARHANADSIHQRWAELPAKLNNRLINFQFRGFVFRFEALNTPFFSIPG